MTTTPSQAIVSIEQALRLVSDAFQTCGCDAHAADITAQALVDAQAQGLASHGLSRVGQYVQFLKNGRSNSKARPVVLSDHDAAVLIDAGNGLAFPACAKAIELAINKARRAGMCAAGITNSHHFGVAAWHLQAVSEAGMVGLAMGNSPAAMPVPGGRRALLGTNPLAASFPRRDKPALVIDLSLSEVARGKIMVAAQRGEPIPAGWALDVNGNPTTDAKAALAGSMLPLGSSGGSAKGGLLALMIELLCTTLTGAHLGFEADSFFQAEGNQPRLGQFFLVIDPTAMAGGAVFHERIESLVDAMQLDPEVRLPGARRQALQVQATRDGLSISTSLHKELLTLAAG